MTPYAILGHPVAHSLSPLIHTTAFEALGLDARYDALDVEMDDLEATVKRLWREGYEGFNVTIPHKEAILPLLEDVDGDAASIGAVNTVMRSDAGWRGTNTDAAGFLGSIRAHLDRISGRAVLILGAGGAARAVIHGLLREAQPASLTILNRTLERAEALAGELAGGDIPVFAESLFQEDLQGLVDASGVIINATSVGMKPYADATPLEEVRFRKDIFLVDLIYAPLETTLMRGVRNAGGTALGGLEMLLQQAARAFLLWTGKEMPVDAVRKKLEAVLAHN